MRALVLEEQRGQMRGGKSVWLRTANRGVQTGGEREVQLCNCVSLTFLCQWLRRRAGSPPLSSCIVLSWLRTLPVQPCRGLRSVQTHTSTHIGSSQQRHSIQFLEYNTAQQHPAKCLAKVNTYWFDWFPIYPPELVNNHVHRANVAILKASRYCHLCSPHQPGLPAFTPLLFLLTFHTPNIFKQPNSGVCTSDLALDDALTLPSGQLIKLIYPSKELPLLRCWITVLQVTACILPSTQMRCLIGCFYCPWLHFLICGDWSKRVKHSASANLYPSSFSTSKTVSETLSWGQQQMQPGPGWVRQQGAL